MKKRQAILRLKLRNKVNDIHRKAALYLCSRYNIIILPKFGIKGIVKFASRLTNRNLLTWSHYTFRELLKAKAKQFPNCRVIGDTEEYTSQTCSYCGTLNKVGGAKVFKCRKCKSEMDRDINGAINIFFKSFSLHEEIKEEEQVDE